MELPSFRIYEGPPERLYADMSYAELADYDYYGSDVSPHMLVEYEYGPQGVNWDIALRRDDNPEIFDVVLYPDGQAYNVALNAF